MDDKLKKLILLMEIKNEEKFSSFTESIKQLDKQGFELMSDIKLLFDEISKVESSVDDTELKSQIESLKESIADIQLQKGENGDKGEDGKNGLDGKDGKDGRDGIDGIDGSNGKDGDNGKDGSPDTPEQIVEKINTLENIIDIKTIKDFPVIEGTADIKRQMDTIGNQVLRLLSRPKTTGGGGNWGSITGTLSDQTDLQNALNAKQNTITTGTTAQYFRGDLSLATFPTNVSTFTNDSGYITSSALSGYVPTTRTLTINGTTLDLSANRSWTISSGTASTGLTNTSGTWTANLSTGISGGQTAIGGTASGNNLTLSSTSNATKGKILFGTSAYDEVNNRLGIGTTSPGYKLDVNGNLNLPNTTSATSGGIYFSGNRFISNYGTENTYVGSGSGPSNFTATGNYNTGVGAGSFAALTSGNFNTALGRLALGAVTSGQGNVGIGNVSFYSITTQSDNTGVGSASGYAVLGSGNTFIGNSAGRSDDVGTKTYTNNTFIGSQAGYLGSTSGISNATAIGYNAQVTTTNSFILGNTSVNVGIGMTASTARLQLPAGTATANTAPLKFTSGTNLTAAEAGVMEYNGSSLFFTRSGTLRAGILMTDLATPFNTYDQASKGATVFTSGTDNILFGNQAGKALTTGNRNILIGSQAGLGVTNFDNVSAIGYQAAQNATGSSLSGFFGYQAGKGASNTYAVNFIGYLAGENSTSVNYSNFFGYQAGQNATSSFSNFIGFSAGGNSTGTGNSSFLGAYAGNGATSSSSATFIGYAAGQSASGASYSIFLGVSAGQNSIASGDSFFAGQNAGRNSGSTESIFVGKNAGYNAVSTGVTGDYNIGLGTDTLKALTTGAGNIALGYKVGDTATTGSKNVGIGYDIDYQSNTADGQLTIQNAIFGTGNTGTGTTASTGKIGIFAPAPNSSLQVTGSMSNSYVAKTANYTLDGTDYLVDCTANSFTVTLPTAVGITGRIYIIKNTGTATIITMATTSSQTIDGTTPPTITTLTPLRVMSDGANWITI